MIGRDELQVGMSLELHICCLDPLRVEWRGPGRYVVHSAELGIETEVKLFSTLVAVDITTQLNEILRLS